MSKAVVFAIAFLLLFLLTLVLPFIPPGDMIINLFEVPAIDIVEGITVQTILNGILNGLIWGLIIFLVYVVVSPGPKKRELEPMRAPSYPTVTQPTATETTSVLTMSAKPQ